MPTHRPQGSNQVVTMNESDSIQGLEVTEIEYETIVLGADPRDDAFNDDMGPM